MVDQKKELNKRLEAEMRDHLRHQVEVYDKAQDKGSKDLLEYRNSKGNLVIDRDLLADYLALNVAIANNALQKWVVIFAFASTFTAILSVLRVLNWIP